MRNRHHRPNQLICGIDKTPFVNVAVVLATLSLFGAMVVPARPWHGGASIDLAKTNAAISMRGANREGALVVGVLRDGKVFFRTEQVTTAELPGKIRDGISQGAERKIYIKADIRGRYATVKEVLDAVRASGVENVAFLTEQRRPQALQ